MTLLDFISDNDSQEVSNGSDKSQEKSGNWDSVRSVPLAEQIEKLKSAIRSDPYLWDMRCWNNYKDVDEIKTWIENDCEPNNCGHVVYCVQTLMEQYKVPLDEVIQLILENPHKQYRKRLVPCFKRPADCIRLAEASGDYSICHPHCLKCSGESS